ncbi:DUF2007 domain-containing protein [Flavobacterium sp. MXW15]|uniref:DUF2007 domain-containing protein n=1 Tax=Xanthomonas chitinilytica TaxID=2989819 RepID=A0ABT3JVH5_9XANT|nr:DUF2007 domain-containing protein [Xanthomonas sp. H13-6]MCW4454890.1 DUF2007 domain-containing protein [Flavobacterium sp. MXW15]MCW4472482.1 DUF2007 domain-containing protein [Xanthomonas sp. H13-6]
MRQIFSSQRVETVEGVAKLLRDAGIEVRISNGRSYHSKRSGQFSYLDKGDAQKYPAVWVVHADDQPRAREILRDTRLLDTTRRDHPTAEFAFRDAPAPGSGRSWAWRIRIGLLLVIGAVAMFVTMRHRGAPAPEPVPAPQQQQPQTPPTPEEEEVRVRIQPTADAPTQ